MKKLIAVVVLASIPIGISAYLYIAGGLGELLLFWAMIAGCVAVGSVATWALVEILDW